MPENSQYLGDGVYASFDGYQIWLDLRGQDNTTRIALEPAVMDALVRYRDSHNTQDTQPPAGTEVNE